MNLVKRAHPVALGMTAAGLAGTASGVVGSLAKAAARGLARRGAPSGGTVDAPVEATVEAREATPPSAPNVVLAEPHAPDEPPVDVVGMALAAEADAEGGAFAHEPRAASREEEHGAALRRTTLDEIIEETAAALEGDIEPEPHLTAPLLDESDTKAVLAELSTMSKAADPDKG